MWCETIENITLLWARYETDTSQNMTTACHYTNPEIEQGKAKQSKADLKT
jgi:hypothetical protein